LNSSNHNQNSAVAIYNTHTDAEAAIKQLQAAGADMKHLSIVGKDYRTEDHVVGYYNTGGNLKYWGKLGAFWAGIWKLLVGEAFFWMPGVGPILVGGPLVTSIVGTLEGSTVHNGLTALGSALHTMGIPKSSVINYESALKANKFLLIVHGANGEACKANEILRSTDPIELAAHGD
jgi:heat induced stress protein YflT